MKTNQNTAFLTLALVCLLSAQAWGQTLTLYPTFRSMGLKVSLGAGYDPDTSAHCTVRYRELGGATWMPGFELDRTWLDGEDQFRGSLFLLDSVTTYEVEVTLLDSTPTVQSQVLPVQSATTRSEPYLGPDLVVRWVSPTGSGNAYSQAQPGNLKVLLQSGIVLCNTTIMVMDGQYTDVNMGLNIAGNCTAQNAIKILAAPGAHPVFDGGYHTPLNWTPHASIPHLYTASLPTGTDFTNLCLLNGRLLYPYPSLTANALFANYNLADLNLNGDGFVRDQTSISVKTQDSLNPNLGNVTLSKAFRWLTVYGNNHDAHLMIRGLKIKNIGKSSVSGTTVYLASALDIRNANHVSIVDCEFEYNETDIAFQGVCDHLLFQDSRFLNGNGYFSHGMIKKSVDGTVLVPSSQGRSKERAAIFLDESNDVVVRRCHFEGHNSGIAGYTQNPVQEVDIYSSTFDHCFDAVEADGNWSNLRVWRNELISPMAAFSMAPPDYGPRYFYRNVVHHLEGRHNVQDDPYFAGCTPPSVYWQAGIGTKTNTTGLGPHPEAGNLYLFNNTFHSEDTLGFVFTSWGGEWRKADWRNNIFYHGQNHVGYFHSLANKPYFQLAMDHNDFFSANPQSPLLVAKEVHGQYVCHDIPSTAQLQPMLRQISGSTNILISNSYNHDPRFVDIANGDFNLDSLSASIDAGVVIPGFRDYLGAAPDLGALESDYIVGLRPALAVGGLRIYPNPSQGQVSLRWEAPDAEAVTVVDMLGHVVHVQDAQGAREARLDVGGLPAGVYLVRVQAAGGVLLGRMVLE